ncbi:MAG: PASTA domain-containing protein [Acutalibacteraceae bacterium]|nr:PASTA domain-containing protein [Acutalibacteraceae bacterium]
MEKEKLCLRCMRKIGDNDFCPYCRKENSEPQKEPFLPLKTVVGGRYLVGKLVASNSEGATYYAFDMEKKTPVTLRELFPKGILSRGEGNYCLVNIGKASEFIDAKEEFVKLWTKLTEIKGFTALTQVYGLVEDLGTVYAVSEYLGEGKTLREFLLEQETGYISWDDARVLFMPVLSALGELHYAGIIHGGICPETLVIDKNGKIRITGYSIEEVRRQKSSMECELFDGYAAVEQYGFSDGLSTSTDIYAFSAVLYRSLIGSVPMSSASRLTNDKLMIPGKFAEQLPAYVINALVNGLQILPDDRTVTAEELRDELSASPAAAGTASEAYSSMYASQGDEAGETVVEEVSLEDETEEIPDSPKIRKSTIAVFVISVILCLAILVVALFGIKGFSDKEEDESTTEETSVEFVSEEDTTGEIGASSISVPNFRGKAYDDIKADTTYNGFLVFKTEYVDSDEKKGTVISQDITEGTLVFEERNITLRISNGREVPNVLNETLKDAIADLKAAGFKKVETVVGNVADNEDDSLKVYSVVCKDSKTDNWVAIPDDRRLSISDKIIIYYYGEYVETTEETTEEIVENEPVEEENNNDSSEE